jgi:7-keto-8-aminopelargonate synthetase-like enzyme
MEDITIVDSGYAVPPGAVFGIFKKGVPERKAAEIRTPSPRDGEAEARPPLDEEARALNLYGVRILRCAGDRRIEIATAAGPRWVVDCATNGPFAMNLRAEVVAGAIGAISEFGALHTSIASARAQTGLGAAILGRLAEMKGGDSLGRAYPTTFAANIAAAAGLAKLDCTAVVHPNAHATVQFALEGAFDAGRLIRTKNTAEVAAAFAKTTRRPVVVVEDGLYSMGKFADFGALKGFLDAAPKGLVWLDDAHSVGMRGRGGRGEAMERMEGHADRCLVTGSFGKAFGAAGGFLVGPASFVRTALGVSVADRFSCNLDVAAQGAVLAAMNLLSRPEELGALQAALAARLGRLDAALADAGVETEQQGTSIAFRVVPFSGAAQAIRAAGVLLEQAGFLTTPVYHPTIARGAGAIRISLSAGHRLDDIDALGAALAPLLRRTPDFPPQIPPAARRWPSTLVKGVA